MAFQNVLLESTDCDREDPPQLQMKNFPSEQHAPDTKDEDPDYDKISLSSCIEAAPSVAGQQPLIRLVVPIVRPKPSSGTLDDVKHKMIEKWIAKSTSGSDCDCAERPQEGTKTPAPGRRHEPTSPVWFEERPGSPSSLWSSAQLSSNSSRGFVPVEKGNQVQNDIAYVGSMFDGPVTPHMLARSPDVESLTKEAPPLGRKQAKGT